MRPRFLPELLASGSGSDYMRLEVKGDTFHNAI